MNARTVCLPQSNQAILWGEDASEAGLTIPSQVRLTHQILQHWQSFRDLKQTFVVSSRVEQLRLRVQQRVVATTDDSVLRTEMDDLEPQEEDDPRSELWVNPMS